MTCSQRISSHLKRHFYLYLIKVFIDLFIHLYPFSVLALDLSYVARFQPDVLKSMKYAETAGCFKGAGTADELKLSHSCSYMEDKAMRRGLDGRDRLADEGRIRGSSLSSSSSPPPVQRCLIKLPHRTTWSADNCNSGV